MGVKLSVSSEQPKELSRDSLCQQRFGIRSGSTHDHDPIEYASVIDGLSLDFELTVRSKNSAWLEAVIVGLSILGAVPDAIA